MRGRVAPRNLNDAKQFPPEMIQNAGRDIAQYRRYKDVFGSSIGSLAEFGQMKYNDDKRWGLFQDYAKSVKNGMISPLSGFKNYVKQCQEIEKSIIGIRTSSGIKITSQSKHFLERVIGTKEDPNTKRPRSGVSVKDIRDALLNGRIRVRAKDPNSIKYITDVCIVSVNPKTGNLIQCNPQ